MYTRVLQAVKRELCQADADEILVPNPMIIPDQDNDFFIGIHSRRPARFGRVAVVETMDVRTILELDQLSILGASQEDEQDEERSEDVDFLLAALNDFELGALLGCGYALEGEELSWDLFAVDEETLAPLGMPER